MTDSFKPRHARVRTFLERAPTLEIEVPLPGNWDDVTPPESHFKTQIYTKEELAMVRGMACTTPAEVNAAISKRRAAGLTKATRRRPVKGYGAGFWHGGLIVLLGLILGCCAAAMVSHLP